MPKPCRVIAVLGTRPEAIKLALVIHELRRRPTEFETAVVHTGQHRTMLDQALQHFKIKPDFDLDVMRANQTLSMLTSKENATDLSELGNRIESGQITPAIDRTYPLSEVPEAIGYMREGHARGKVVVTL